MKLKLLAFALAGVLLLTFVFSNQVAMNLEKIDKSPSLLYEARAFGFGDFNLRRILPDHYRWILTESLSYPDTSDWGSVLPLLPFLATIGPIQVLGFDLQNACFLRHADRGESLALLFFLIGSLYLLGQIGQMLDLPLSRIGWVSLLGTPLLWTFLYLPKNGTLSFLFSLLLSLWLYLDSQNRNRDLFRECSLGLCLGICSLADATGFLYTIGILFLDWQFNKSSQRLKTQLGIVSGFAVVLVLRAALQYFYFHELFFPFWTAGEVSIESFHQRFEFVSLLTGPRGLLYLFPVWGLSLLGAFEYLRRTSAITHKQAFVVGLSFIPVLQFFLTARFGKPQPYQLGLPLGLQIAAIPLGLTVLGKSGLRPWLLRLAVGTSVVWSLLMTLRYASEPHFFELRFEPLDQLFWSHVAGSTGWILNAQKENFFYSLGAAAIWTPLGLFSVWCLTTQKRSLDRAPVLLTLIFAVLVSGTLIRGSLLQANPESLRRDPEILVTHDHSTYYLMEVLRALDRRQDELEYLHETDPLDKLLILKSSLRLTIFAANKAEIEAKPPLAKKILALFDDRHYFDTPVAGRTCTPEDKLNMVLDR